MVVASPRPSPSLTASARRLVGRKVDRNWQAAAEWQAAAWDMFDLVGEQRFLATTLAGRMSQAKLYVGELTDEATDRPTPTDNAQAAAVLDAFGGSAVGRGQMIYRLGVNLFVAGDGWIAGIPRDRLPENRLADAPELAMPRPTPPTLAGPGEPPVPDLKITDLDWRALSVTEIESNASGDQLTLKLGTDKTEQVKVTPDDVWLFRIWRPHPRRAWEADSPTRASLPVLRELVSLTMHISAQVDSRLAGAGLLIMPNSAKAAIRASAGLAEDDDSDPFTEALIEAMIKPIEDRASASAYVPLVVTVPDEAVDKFNFMTFSKDLDSEARPLREEAIRRLALGQDAPPELLLGTGGMNHWGAWLVQEEVVTTHLEPPLALICDAITSEYLWPVLIQQGMTPEQAHRYVIWYDVSDLITRPNRSADAFELHARNVISDEALRQATGFDDSDAPDVTQGMSTAVQIVIDMVKQAPSLAQNPGLPALLVQVKDILDGNVVDSTPIDTTTQPGGIPIDQPAGQRPEQPPADAGPPAADTAPAPTSRGLTPRQVGELSMTARQIEQLARSGGLV